MTLHSLIELTFWASLLAASIRVATPLLFTSLGEAVAERAGLLNVGVEGMMALGAICGFLAAYATDSVLIALAAAMIVGALAGLVFGLLTVVRGADQIVTGIVLNILALGAASFLYQTCFASSSDVPQLHVSSSAFPIPVLSDIPLLGRALFAQSPVVYLAYLLIIIFWVLLQKTIWGLNVKAIGENPEAADTVGLDVWGIRLQAIVLGGAMAGLGGATIAVCQVGAYVDGMISGRGFIVLAIVVFGGWNPWRIALAALLFGAADALQLRLQISNIGLPNQLLLGLPYLLTILVVVFTAGRAGYPSAINQPYRRRGLTIMPQFARRLFQSVLSRTAQLSNPQAKVPAIREKSDERI
ncbi:ABC transporter permease [Rhizobium sp. LEGMi135b]